MCSRHLNYPVGCVAVAGASLRTVSANGFCARMARQTYQKGNPRAQVHCGPSIAHTTAGRFFCYTSSLAECRITKSILKLFGLMGWLFRKSSGSLQNMEMLQLQSCSKRRWRKKGGLTHSPGAVCAADGWSTPAATYLVTCSTVLQCFGLSRSGLSLSVLLQISIPS